MENPPGLGGGGGGADRSPSPFSSDISRMSEAPPRSQGHRRAHSEILTLPDDLSFDSDLGVVGAAGEGGGGGGGGGDAPSLSDETDEDFFSMYMDMDKFCSATSPPLPGAGLAQGAGSGASERPRPRHQHSLSMDGSTSTIKPEMLGGEGGPSLAEAKKAMSAAKLADLALVDPKRAKRIWANRQSAARSKERKMRYIQELERKLQTLQTEATTLSAQLTLLQRDTNGLTAENSELKLRLQNMEQQVHLQDALNDALREEVQRLKLATGQLGAGQVLPNGGQMMNFGPPPFGNNQQFYHSNHATVQSLLAAHQLQQLQIHSQHQQQLHSPHNQLQHQHQQLQQLPVDLKLKGVMSSQHQREGPTDRNNNPKE